MQTCKQIPFSSEMYCYSPVYLSFYDKLFIAAILAMAFAIFIGWMEGKFK